MKELYIALTFPDYQQFMETQYWESCEYCAGKDIIFVPIDVYETVTGTKIDLNK